MYLFMYIYICALSNNLPVLPVQFAVFYVFFVFSKCVSLYRYVSNIYLVCTLQVCCGIIEKMLPTRTSSHHGQGPVVIRVPFACFPGGV